MSSLLTAVLTNYLGWIATCYVSNSNLDNEILPNSYNAICCQLRDLCGLTGTSKTSRIIVYNSNENFVKDALDFIRYFIRYFRVQSRYIERENTAEESEISKNILKLNVAIVEKPRVIPKCKSLHRTKTFSSNLAELVNIEQSLDIVPEEESVIFILGDDEKLKDLKKNSSSSSVANKITHDKGSDMNENCIYALQTNSNSNSGVLCSNSNSGVENKDSFWNMKQKETKKRMKVVRFPLPK